MTIFVSDQVRLELRRRASAAGISVGELVEGYVGPVEVLGALPAGQPHEWRMNASGTMKLCVWCHCTPTSNWGKASICLNR
jgi:hypothetical protein